MSSQEMLQPRSLILQEDESEGCSWQARRQSLSYGDDLLLLTYITAPLFYFRLFLGRTSVQETAAAAPALRWTSWACPSTAPTSAPNPSTVTPSTPCGTSTFSSLCTLKRCAFCASLLWRTTALKLLLRELCLWKPSSRVGGESPCPSHLMISNHHLCLIRMLFCVLCVSGYRHIQLRTQHNESLEVSSLFVYSRRTEECPTGGDIPSSLVSLNELSWLGFTF